MHPDNPNISLLLGLYWLQSIDTKLLKQKKKTYVGDTKKQEVVSHISCSTTSPKDNCFLVNSKAKGIVNKFSKENDIGQTNENDFDESDEVSTKQDFLKILVMILIMPQS